MANADWKQIDAKLTARAWEDPAFKALLLANPKAAAAQAGVALPGDAELKVVEEGSGVPVADKPGVHTLVLPASKAAEEFELSDEELEGVAGAGPGGETSAAMPTCPGYVSGACN